MRTKVAVSTYSFSNILYTERMPTLEDLFRTIHELGIEGVEIVAFNIVDPDVMPRMSGDPDKSPDPVLPDGSAPNQAERPQMKMDPELRKAMRDKMSQAGRVRPASIDRIKDYLKKYGLTVCNMPVDFGDIGNPDETARKSDIEMLKLRCV